VANEVKRATLDIEARAKAVVAVDTGTLRRSIASVFSNGGLTGVVGPSVFYGKFIEFGTRRMGARPFMRPAAEAVLPKFAEAVKRALRALK
jgi:HK97 gp10 family phage protein